MQGIRTPSKTTKENIDSFLPSGKFQIGAGDRFKAVNMSQPVACRICWKTRQI